MYFKKYGFPEEGDLVFCTVTNVQYNSVFVQIEEYGRQGLIHISEISPGRIRNIRDFVKEGKMIVCKVIMVDERKGHIDLSLRRVTEIQRKQKIDERKQEQKAEKISDSVATELGVDPVKFYEEISKSIFKSYEYLHYAFEDVVEEGLSLDKLGIKKEFSKPLTSAIKEKIKPKEVNIGGVLALKTYDGNGVDIVKSALIKAKGSNPAVSIKYLGAGTYSLSVIAKEYKSAEKILNDALELVQSVKSSLGGAVSFKRTDKD